MVAYPCRQIARLAVDHRDAAVAEFGLRIKGAGKLEFVPTAKRKRRRAAGNRLAPQGDGPVRSAHPVVARAHQIVQVGLALAQSEQRMEEELKKQGSSHVTHPSLKAEEGNATLASSMPEPRLIRKCVVPAAGLGTRFLPATKAIPKEMLPIVDTPTLQYIVQEAASAGIEDVILVNGRGKSSIEDHFDLAVELEAVLKSRGKEQEWKKLRAISNLVNIVSVRQKEPLGLGHAVLCAKNLIGNEPFGVILGDDVIDSVEPGIRQLARAFQKHHQGVIALMEVPPSEAHLYGVAAGEWLDERTIRITHLADTPNPTPSPPDPPPAALRLRPHSRPSFRIRQ